GHIGVEPGQGYLSPAENVRLAGQALHECLCESAVAPVVALEGKLAALRRRKTDHTALGVSKVPDDGAYVDNAARGRLTATAFICHKRSVASVNEEQGFSGQRVDRPQDFVLADREPARLFWSGIDREEPEIAVVVRPAMAREIDDPDIATGHRTFQPVE